MTPSVMERAAFVHPGSAFQFVRRANTAPFNRRPYFFTLGKMRPSLYVSRTFHYPIIYGTLNSEAEKPSKDENKDNSMTPGTEAGIQKDSERLLKKLEDLSNRNDKTVTEASSPQENPSGTPKSSVSDVPPVTALSAAVPAVATPTEKEEVPEGLRKASRALWRIGWFTWWAQLILTVIAAVILLFAFVFPGINVRSAASAVGLGVSGVGVIIAFLSLFWTYGYTRLAIWLRVNQHPEKAKVRINRKLRFGLLFSVVGMVVLLVGLQAVVGTLLARVFGGISATYGPAPAPGGLVPSASLVQPVDILVIQACANALTGLMMALVATTWFRSKESRWSESLKSSE
ncbi:Protein TIC 21, chloroplastic [Gracilariopsis chorda]|uniref:Protein TIC 21, chloroplastic n=1 Tax=Gracilariopsis chorda TaxID=448386 RepID=A0A2V3J4F6_9FLOR|nr:Protein TIC 21, chloroplastic [Gracilariopsis chorda]|eukprot:PXF49264.1 Protein TIC 21, chloroplastic [Gracilariopsis chorda]